MIRGTVNSNNEAVLPLRVRGPGGTELDVDAIIDTGFTGSITLPPAIISALNLTGQSQVATRLGDGTMCYLDAYDVEIEWDGVWITVVVWEIDATPLLGMGLLTGHEMFIEFVPGGVVDITKLP
jgi:clan AA aspartic protease